MSAAPSPAASHSRQKPLTMGITAGAEDAKYQTKYKELKRKVKDIETDNDKLHFRVLQAKLSIRRMKMERAILYERLSAVPPSPNFQDRYPLPPVASGNGGLPPPLGHGYDYGHVHQHPQRVTPGGVGHRELRDHPYPMELDQSGNGVSSLSNNTNNLNAPEHLRTHPSQSHPLRGPGTGDARVTGTDHHHPRPLSGEFDNPPATSSPHMLIHSPPRKIPSAHGHHHPQHLPPQTLPPVHQYGPESHTHTSPPPPIRHSSSTSGGAGGSHSSPGIQPHSGSHPPTKPYRGNGVSGSSSNSGSNHGPGPGSATVTGQYPQIQYPESLSTVKQPLHSPPLSERDREWVGRQSHQHQHPNQHQHGHHHHHVHHHHHQPQHSAHLHPHEYSAASHGGDPAAAAHPYEPSTEGGGRATTRIHPHSRLPYEYPPQEVSKRDRDRDREREKERDRDLDRTTEWERERDRAREYSRGELTNYSPHRTRSSAHLQHEHNHNHHHHHSASSSRARAAASATTAVSSAHNSPYAHGPPPPTHPSGTEPTDDPQSYFSRAATPASGSGSAGGPAGYGHGSGGGPEGANVDTRDREWDRDQERERERERERGSGSGGRSSQRVRLITRASTSAPDDGELGGQAPAATAASSNGNNPSLPPLIEPSLVETGKKRSRNEMEVDDDDKEGGGHSNGTARMPIPLQDESLRGPTPKRYHREVDSPDGR